VTRWGLLLLVAYLVIGLSPLDARKAVRYALVTTTIIMLLVGVRSGSL
jgi:hypothetical protein